MVRSLLGGRTYLEKAGVLVAHPGAEPQRWHMDTPHLFIPAAVALSTLLPGVDYVATLRARAPGGGADDYGVASVTLRVAKDGVAARIAGA